jgi:hypothetical protein
LSVSIVFEVYARLPPSIEAASDGSFAIDVESIDVVDREGPWSPATAPTSIVRFRGGADHYETMCRSALALAETTGGWLFDPQDGRWLDRFAVGVRLDGQHITEEAVEALVEEIAALRAEGCGSGPSSLRVLGPGPYDDWVAQFLVMAAADIDEGEAYVQVVSGPFTLLDGLSVRGARELAAIFGKARVPVELVAAS